MPQPQPLALPLWLLAASACARCAGAFGFAWCLLPYELPGYASCTGRGITQLGPAIAPLPNSTLWLNASQNALQGLAPATFAHLPRLRELRLDRNRIRALETGAFQGLQELELLDLSQNQLVALGPTELAELTGLQVLLLGGNVLATLHPNALAAQPGLLELHLPNNQLSQLQEVATATGKLANLSLLDLDSNRISAPCPGPGLISMPFLRDLNLRNNSITWLDLARCSLPGLHSLNLTRNNMSGLEAGSFRAAPGLEKLSLDENPLNISHLLGLPLPNLTALHWSSMRPALDSDLGLACQVLGSLSALTSLDIKHSKVPPSRLALLGACTNLTWLDLSTTPLSRLQGGVFRLFTRLESLSLDKCKVQQLKQSAWGGALPRLRVLILRRNHLTKLEDGVFRPLSALTHLDLSRNRLTYLYKGTFLGMASLRTLLLQGCQLAAVTRDTFVYARKVEALDLSDNNLQYIKTSAFQSLLHLRTLLLSGNRILTLQKWAFKGLTSLRHLSLAQNGLYKLSQGSFLGLKALETLDLSRNRLLAYGKYDSPAPFAGLPALRGLDLGSQEARPPVRLPSKLFQGLGNLQELSLRDNPGGIFLNLSLAPLAGLLFLDLSDIYPSREGPFSLRPGLFQGLGSLRRLRLDGSSLRDLPGEVFSSLASLEWLSLRENGLRNVSRAPLAGLAALRFLDVAGNPLACSCENAWFQNWSAAEPGVQVALLGSYLCLGPSVSEGLFQAHDLSFCWADLGIVFFAGSFAAISLTLVGSLASAKLGWTLRYGFYLLRAWGWGRLRRDRRGYQYDAYVSCCAEDEAWVVHTLLAKLEEEGLPRFRLCFGPRDFAPGVYYLDNVQRGVSGSRKALCLLSARALESEWCSLEIHLACARAYYRGHDPLVVVFLEDIPNFRLSPYHRLRKLVKQRSYLQWPEQPEAQDVFWTQLREALADGGEAGRLVPFNVAE
ncbi:toll-like receptor 13 [Gopherus flavomarginatus]|uniref:toll-like receptor 13 n=1 Tax=Gopherus flavomarginatus TaxID=286002 RepID=UPI0021CC35CF|nr:toll-like receptor 13 [Gopherus flavomarginatus]XP_050784229.1 toll-like receptor 13 [Gopherus flavomarginatus]XP_050784230.1 toll-like receptor 13 [Gopherus flavomarginatus]XP_050784231.1 toll-like receptor 13 [Gopherus flavomarginatus]XP_050784232.1 toll-like receptor 13 [Gopherus flavomarginatus]